MSAEIQSWLDTQVPDLVRDLRERWSLRLGPPYQGGTCAWAAPATLPDGTAAVLKVSWPHSEAAGEAEALRLWNGRGAVRLYRHDPERWAMLLERCDPGTKLGEASELTPEERLVRGAQVLRSLWTPLPAGHGLPTIRRVLGEWADLTEERMGRLRPGFDPGLVAWGVKLMRELPATAGREVLVHCDFNPGNVLAADGRGWLAIDPKPMAGDPGYDPWPLVEQVDDPFGYARPHRVVAARYALVADVLSEDADVLSEDADVLGGDADLRRLLAWSVARCVEDALWTVEQGDHAGGGELMAKARLLAELGDG